MVIVRTNNVVNVVSRGDVALLVVYILGYWLFLFCLVVVVIVIVIVIVIVTVTCLRFTVY
jgi:hypothetical protein